MADTFNDQGSGPGAAEPKRSFKEVAIRVLQEHGDREPMHYTEIVREAIDGGLLVSPGKTPERSMNRTLNQHLGDLRNPDPKAAFYRDEWRDGYYGLYEWRKSGIPQAKEWNRRYVHGEIMKRVGALDEVEFVGVAKLLIGKMGFRDFQEVEKTPRNVEELNADLDVPLPTGRAQHLTYRVQVRKNMGPVTESHVQHLSRAMKSDRIRNGLIIGRGRASGDLVGAAGKLRQPIGIVAGNELGHRLMEFGVGSTETDERLFQLEGFGAIVDQAEQFSVAEGIG